MARIKKLKHTMSLSDEAFSILEEMAKQTQLTNSMVVELLLFYAKENNLKLSFAKAPVKNS